MALYAGSCRLHGPATALAMVVAALCGGPVRATPSESATVELTMAGVALHDRADDCWLVIDGAVYDVTRFIAGHPGGEAILRGCGKDATRLFRQRDAAGGHSASAEAILRGFRIGALGERVAISAAEPAAGPHAHDLRARSRWVGLLASPETSPPWSFEVHVKHHLVTDPAQRSRIGVILGIGLWPGLDVHVGDVTGDGVSHVEVRGRLLDRSGPVALAVALGGEFLRVEDDGDDDSEGEPRDEPASAEAPIDRGPPSLYGQIAAEIAVLDRLIALRFNGLGFVQPGFDEGLALGVGVELRPDPLYGLFAEGVVPLLDDPTGAPIWSVGARLYTLGHHFGLYIASSPTASVTPLAGRPPAGVAAGFSIARAFLF